jgi:hypothetical protein
VLDKSELVEKSGTPKLFACPVSRRASTSSLPVLLTHGVLWCAVLCCVQEYMLAPPDQLMQVLMGVIKAHMAAEPNCFKVRGGCYAAGVVVRGECLQGVRQVQFCV